MSTNQESKHLIDSDPSKDYGSNGDSEPQPQEASSDQVYIRPEHTLDPEQFFIDYNQYATTKGKGLAMFDIALFGNNFYTLVGILQHWEHHPLGWVLVLFITLIMAMQVLCALLTAMLSRININHGNHTKDAMQVIKRKNNLVSVLSMITCFLSFVVYPIMEYSDRKGSMN